MEEIIDRGSLFKYTQDYNLNAIVPSNFHWTNVLPDAFFNIKDIKTYPPRHYDQISISKSMSYMEILAIVAKYTPKTIFITKRISDNDDVPDTTVDLMKLKNLTCLIYFFDLKLNFIIKYFPNIKYLFVDSVDFVKSTHENFKNASLNNLELFCVGTANKYALNINAPNLTEMNLYKWKNVNDTPRHNNKNKNTNTTTTNSTTTTASNTNAKATTTQPTNNANDNQEYNEIPVFEASKFSALKILRIDDNIKINLNQNLTKMNSLQFIFHQPLSSPKTVPKDDKNILKNIIGSYETEYYLNLISLTKPSEIILPPNVLTVESIRSLSGYGVKKAGIYISENYLIDYFEAFPDSLEIYDFNNLHACLSLRYADDLTKYISRTYTSVAPDFKDLILGMPINNVDDNNIIKESLTDSITSTNSNQNNIVCLTNFDLSNSNYSFKWMYMFNHIESEFKMKPIIITRCEVVKPEKEFAWPSMVWAMKKRVMIMNLQKQSLHIDISNISTYALINLLDSINGSFPFKTLIIVTHGFVLTPTNIMQIKTHFEDVNITVQDVPYVLYS